MTTKLISKNRNKKGSVMVEAALTIPLILGITLFIIEFGNVLYLNNSLSQISRSAARYASVTPAYTQTNIVEASGANSLLPDPSKLTLTITPAPGTAKSVGTTITVTTSYNYTPIVNPFGLFKSDNPWLPSIMSTAIGRSEVSSAS